MKKLTTIFAVLVLALTACTGQESKQRHAIPPYLKSLGVETLILGNRGQGAIEAIAASGLKEIPGITGSADEAAELFAKGELKPNFEAKCDHHGEHHN